MMDWRSTFTSTSQFPPTQLQLKGAALSRLQERKNSLYCPNNVPKKRAKSELIFIDQHLKTLDELKRRVCSFNCNVVHTYKMLSGRFRRDTVTAAERSRKRRRNKEQRRKSIKRQKEKGKKQAFKLIPNICGKEKADQVFSGNLLADTEKLNSLKLGVIKLLPYFYLNALEYLLQIDAMDNKETVQYYIALLKTRKQMKAVPPNAEDQPPEDQSSESSGNETDLAVCHQRGHRTENYQHLIDRFKLRSSKFVRSI